MKWEIKNVVNIFKALALVGRIFMKLYRVCGIG